MKNKILLLALGTMATTSIAYGSQYPLLHGWPEAPQTAQPTPNYYDLPTPPQGQPGQQQYSVPPEYERYPGLAQISQQPQQPGVVSPTAPPMDEETAALLAQQQAAAMAAHAKTEKPHHDDVIRHQAFLPVEMATGYGLGLLMSDEILGLLKKLGLKKDTKVDLEKLKKRRVWYIPAVLLAGYLMHRFGPRSEVTKFVECACDQRGFHEVTRVSIFDRLGNAALGYLIGLIMPHLEAQPANSKKPTDQPGQARS